jgi:hypothetical protein
MFTLFGTFVVLLIEMFLWLRSGQWPGWSGLTFLLPLISGSEFSNWLTNPSSWRGLHAIVHLALDLPLWLWGCAVASLGMDLLEPKKKDWDKVIRMRFHGILVDGRVEMFEGTLVDAEDRIDQLTSEGKSAAYLFEAESEEEFSAKREAEQRRAATDSF